jgi:hypothetical protein
MTGRRGRCLLIPLRCGRDRRERDHVEYVYRYKVHSEIADPQSLLIHLMLLSAILIHSKSTIPLHRNQSGPYPQVSRTEAKQRYHTTTLKAVF